jgi:hypothetical protein
VLVPAGITEAENSVAVLHEPADTGQPMPPKDITKPGGPPTRIVTICAKDSPREGDVDELLLNVKPGVVNRVAKDALGDRIAGGAIDRGICPPVYRLIIHEGVEADVEPVLRALEQRSGVDAGRVAIDSSPYTMKELKEAADRAARVLRDEPIDSWGVSYDETRGRIGVEAPELRVEAFEKIERTAGVPVRFAIASGPAESR